MKPFFQAKKEFLNNIMHNKMLFNAHAEHILGTMHTIKDNFPNLSDKEMYTLTLESMFSTGVISKSLNKLYKQITPHALVVQCDFLLSNDQKCLFNDLQEKHKIRIERDMVRIPRTFTLEWKKEGVIDFYLESKSKIATMQEMLIVGTPVEKLSIEDKKNLKKSGAKKTGKPCWKLSKCPPEEYYSLVSNTPLGSIKDKPPTQSESEYLSLFRHPFGYEGSYANLFGQHVAYLEGGIIYVTKNGVIKACAYSKAANASLNEFISNTGLVGFDKQKATETEKYRVIKHILLAIKAMHDKGCVHQDLKVSNILVYETPISKTGKINMKIKIADLEYAVMIEKPTFDPSATVEYASPEVFALRLYMKNKYFENPNLFSYGRQVWREIILGDPRYIQAKQQGYNEGQMQKLEDELICACAKDNIEPAKHNDMWAMGIMAYEILFGTLPNKQSKTYYDEIKKFKSNIRSNALLTGLLDMCKQKRLTVEEALEKVTVAQLELASKELCTGVEEIKNKILKIEKSTHQKKVECLSKQSLLMLLQTKLKKPSTLSIGRPACVFRKKCA